MREIRYEDKLRKLIESCEPEEVIDHCISISAELVHALVASKRFDRKDANDV